MPDSDSYGEAFGNRLNAQANSFVTRALPKAMIAVTELKYTNPSRMLSTPPIREDAFLVAVHLKYFPKYEYWENGKAAPASVLKPGETIVYDIKRQPTFHLNNPFHSVHFYLPRATLDALADEANARPINELHYKPAVSHQDPVMRGITEALLPMFQNPHQVDQLFMDHLMLTVGHHAATRYGGMRPVARSASGGLSSSQERRTKELFSENLLANLPLATLARECGLSLSQFSKAFRKTFGVPPHKWMMQQRITLAKALLLDGIFPLTEVASSCGFSDQSHFTRCFTATVGISPGAWRRAVRK
ncbi:MAG: AraC family transcriptional regulator [Rhizomicrobium sp.]